MYPLAILVWIVFQYSHGYYIFPVLARILPFLGTHTDCTLFRYSSQQFFGTHNDCTLFRYSFRQFLVTRTHSNFFRYLPAFYHFWVLTQIVPSSDTRTDSTFSRYSPGFYNFWVLRQIVPSSDTRPDTFSVLARKLTFLGSRPDSIIFGYSQIVPSSDTRPDSFLVITRI